MALSLDDKILGEKVHNYCSSDEESDGENEKQNESGDGKQPTVKQPSFTKYAGYSTNTGPKGVLNDWREFKRLENERRVENQAEKLALAQKLSLTCHSYLNEDEKSKTYEEDEGTDLDSDFLQEYRQRRLEEMKKAVQAGPTYGDVLHLDTTNYVDAVDKELPSVTIIIHIYNKKVPACEAMSGSFKCLCKEYPRVKFCEISAIDSNLSDKFVFDGVPAILVYRDKQLIGNFIRLGHELGDDFYATDVESFLHEHGMLPFDDVEQTAIRDRSTQQPALDDSDFDVD